MKKLLSVIFFIIILLSLAPLRQSFAATNFPNAWSGRGFGTENDQSMKTGSVSVLPYINNAYYGNLMSFTCGIIPFFGSDLCYVDPSIGYERFQESAIGSLSNYVIAMYSVPPASTKQYIAYAGQSLGFLPKTAHAQGTGFNGLSNLLPLWKNFRNVAYLLMAIAMIAIGFMVMFRRRIDPKTVVTVQNALPRIIITLLLITFSYAIVGILIDLMYLSIALAVNMFKPTGLLPDPGFITSKLGYSTPEKLYTTGGLLENFANIEVNPYKLFGLNVNAGIATNISLFILAPLLALAGGGLVGVATGGGLAPIGALIGGIIGLSGPIFHALIAAALLFLFIRLFIFFIGAYIQIIIALLFGPIQIMFEAFPGTGAFSSWFKNLVGNVSIFPISAMVFMLSAVFAKFSNSGGDLWAPPFSPLVSSVTAMSTAISLGLLFAIPSIAGQIRELLKAKPFIAAGPEGVVGSFAHPVQLGLQAYQLFQSHQTTDLLRKNVLRQQTPGGGTEENS